MSNGSEEIFYLCVVKPTEGTPEQIRDWVERAAQDLADSDSMELVAVTDGGEPIPQSQRLRAASDPGDASLAKAAFIFRIRCPGKALTEYEFVKPRLPEPDPLRVPIEVEVETFMKEQ